MFIEDEELLEIVVHYKKAGRHYVAYNDQVFNEIGLSDEEKENFQKLTVKARQLTWGLYNDLQEAAMVKDELGNRNWNYKVYKEHKLRSIIAQWDATMKNGEGELVAIWPKTHIIAKISPEIADVILNT